MKYTKYIENGDGTKEIIENCFEYGMSRGCDENCPTLINGECEVYESVEEFLLENK